MHGNADSTPKGGPIEILDLTENDDEAPQNKRVVKLVRPNPVESKSPFLTEYCYSNLLKLQSYSHRC